MEYNVLFEIKKLDHLAMQNLMKGKNLEEHPSSTQIRIMQYMMENKESDVYQKDLEHHLNISRATISNVLNTMEKNEIIERFFDSQDTRIKKVRLTKKSLEIHNKAKQETDELIKKMIANISNNDIETFIRIIKQMEENLL